MLFRTPIRPGDLRREEEGQGGPLTAEGERLLAQREKEDADRKIWDKISALFFRGEAKNKFVHEIVDGLNFRQLEELHPFLDISRNQESIKNALAYLELSGIDSKKQKENYDRMLEIRNELTNKIELDDYMYGEPINDTKGSEEEKEEDLPMAEPFEEDDELPLAKPVEEDELPHQLKKDSNKHEAA